MDELSIWNRPLTNAEISEIYTHQRQGESFFSLLPIADAGPDQTVNEGVTITLDGTGSQSSGGALQYSWNQLAGPVVTLDDATAAQPSFVSPYVSENKTLSFELSVSDDNGTAEAPDTVDVTVVNTNNPPEADAGDDSTIKEGALASLDGSNSYDPEDDNISYSWFQVAGPPVELVDPVTELPDSQIVNPTFRPNVGDAGTVVFQLQVCDGKECSTRSAGANSINADTVAVTIVENSAPIANAGPDRMKAEGSTAQLDGSASDDPDGGDSLSFSWTQTGGDAVSLSGAATATPTFDAPPVASGGADFEFMLTVTDDDPLNPKSTSDSVVVHVRNINDPPTCNLAVPSTAKLWPPNHKMKAIDIDGVMDSDSTYNTVTLVVTGVTQDEPVNGLGDGDSSPDAVIQPNTPANSVLIRAERSGNGNGRVYTVSFSADDGFESCGGEVSVSVPKGRKKHAIDDGQVYDSTVQ